ncbi:MAG: hypothetical protein Kow00121_18220 [Elainellaceae cyanobacterium]
MVLAFNYVEALRFYSWMLQPMGTKSCYLTWLQKQPRDKIAQSEAIVETKNQTSPLLRITTEHAKSYP